MGFRSSNGAAVEATQPANQNPGIGSSLTSAPLSVAQTLAGSQLGGAASLLVASSLSSSSRDAMIARATAIGRGAMAQSAAAAAAVSSTGALKRIFALAESAKEGAVKKDMASFRRLFNG